MRKLAEITYQGVEEDKRYPEIIDKTYEECFKEEKLFERTNLYKCNTIRQRIHKRNKLKI